MFEIAATVKYSDDNNLTSDDFECNGDPTFKSNRPQSRPNVITARPSNRKSFERRARRLKPVNISSSGRVTVSFCDKSVEVEEVSFGLRPKDDFEVHRARFNWRA